jgi:hypothetical protein
MNWPCRTVAAACMVVGLSSPSVAGQVKLVIHDGLVTLEATDATRREIFAEWARVGQTRFVNVETAPGDPMTLQLVDVPESQALEILLRSAAGFLAAPRAVPQASGSTYDRIILMPGTRPAPRATSAAPAAAGQSPQAWIRGNVPPPTAVVDDDDEPVPTPQPRGFGAQGGAAQPGMPTIALPFNGAGVTFPSGTQVQPMPQGSPYYNPNGMPFGSPDRPNQPDPNGTAQRPAPAVPQAAPRPGVPTLPAGPIKG